MKIIEICSYSKRQPLGWFSQGTFLRRLLSSALAVLCITSWAEEAGPDQLGRCLSLIEQKLTYSPDSTTQARSLLTKISQSNGHQQLIGAAIMVSFSNRQVLQLHKIVRAFEEAKSLGIDLPQELQVTHSVGERVWFNAFGFGEADHWLQAYQYLKGLGGFEVRLMPFKASLVDKIENAQLVVSANSTVSEMTPAILEEVIRQTGQGARPNLRLLQVTGPGEGQGFNGMVWAPDTEQLGWLNGLRSNSEATNEAGLVFSERTVAQIFEYNDTGELKFFRPHFAQSKYVVRLIGASGRSARPVFLLSSYSMGLIQDLIHRTGFRDESVNLLSGSDFEVLMSCTSGVCVPSPEPSGDEVATAGLSEGQLFEILDYFRELKPFDQSIWLPFGLQNGFLFIMHQLDAAGLLKSGAYESFVGRVQIAQKGEPFYLLSSDATNIRTATNQKAKERFWMAWSELSKILAQDLKPDVAASVRLNSSADLLEFLKGRHLDEVQTSEGPDLAEPPLDEGVAEAPHLIDPVSGPAATEGAQDQTETQVSSENRKLSAQDRRTETQRLYRQAASQRPDNVALRAEVDAILNFFRGERVQSQPDGFNQALLSLNVKLIESSILDFAAQAKLREMISSAEEGLPFFFKFSDHSSFRDPISPAGARLKLSFTCYMVLVQAHLAPEAAIALSESELDLQALSVQESLKYLSRLREMAAQSLSGLLLRDEGEAPPAQPHSAQEALVTPQEQAEFREPEHDRLRRRELLRLRLPRVQLEVPAVSPAVRDSDSLLDWSQQASSNLAAIQRQVPNKPRFLPTDIEALILNSPNPTTVEYPEDGRVYHSLVVFDKETPPGKKSLGLVIDLSGPIHLPREMREIDRSSIIFRAVEGLEVLGVYSLNDDGDANSFGPDFERNYWASLARTVDEKGTQFEIKNPLTIGSGTLELGHVRVSAAVKLKLLIKHGLTIETLAQRLTDAAVVEPRESRSEGFEFVVRSYQTGSSSRSSRPILVVVMIKPDGHFTLATAFEI